MNDNLRTMLKQLRLSGLIESLDVRLQEAAGHGLNHAEFLELVLQDELLVRGDRLVERRVKAAQFREVKTLDHFDWSFNPSIHKKQLFDLATCRFVREHRDVLQLGPPGASKTNAAEGPDMADADDPEPAKCAAANSLATCPEAVDRADSWDDEASPVTGKRRC